MKTQSEYLENERSIPLYPALAHTFGVNAAIILQQIRYWMITFEKAEQGLPIEKRLHFHNDRWWVYNTYEQWQSDNFGFWSKRTIQRHINTLEMCGVLLADEFNKSAGDRTKWYTIDFDEMDRLVRQNTDELTPSGQNDEMVSSTCLDHLDKVAHSITETTTESTQETTEKDQKNLPPTAAGGEAFSDETPKPEHVVTQSDIFGACCWALDIDPQYVPSKRKGTIGQAATEIHKHGGTPEDVTVFMEWLKKKLGWKHQVTEHDMGLNWCEFKTEQDRKTTPVHYDFDTPGNIALREKAAGGWRAQTPETLEFLKKIMDEGEADRAAD